ncbi:hypothetical protein GOP47_0006887 [Adiantum capillus-veneris]|uniref:Pentatricopeptide repeat-containing protein n=1 Tax=Adiantum capillus-veneris TaxID=13818 RepID=A0A9D4V3R6_ADICA|nr:hypothetical protein GOP47_0006887 [Adiantum capillus-veneris]
MCLLLCISSASTDQLGHQKTRQDGVLSHGCHWVPERQPFRVLQPPSNPQKVANGYLRVDKTNKQATESHETLPVAQVEEKAQEELWTSSQCIHQNPKEKIEGRISVLGMLKVCEQQKDLHSGSNIHVDLIKSGFLEKDIFVGSALINMYAKCGALAKAHEVFDALPLRNIVSWNALISGYAQHGHGQQALTCFEQLELEGLSPNAVTFSSILKACSNIGAIKEGQKVHCQILRDGLVEKDIIVGTGLVDMYCKCGLLARAESVFHELRSWNVISWNVLILGYAQYGYCEEALSCFELMKARGFCPDSATMVCTLKACTTIGASDKAQEIHSNIVKEGIEGRDIVATHALINMYAKCGYLTKAEHLFQDLPVWDLPSCTALISGYAQHDHGKEAMGCFEWMQSTGISPDAVTFSCILKACGGIGTIDKGVQIHAQISNNNLLEGNTVVGTALVDMYAKFGMLEKSQEMFNKLPFQDVVAWNALINGYTQHGHGEEALLCYQRMQLEHLSPDAVTFSCCLKACGILGDAFAGQEIHHDVVRKGFSEKKITVANALIDMYAKCGLLAEAQDVFDRLSNRDTISWGAFIAGYVQHDRYEEAIVCFDKMQNDGQSPDACTYVSVIKACGSIGAADKGQEIHSQIVGDDLVEIDVVVSTALVDMYAKCGRLLEAQDMFDDASICDLILFNALVSGYAQFGKVKIGLNTLAKMLKKGVEPDLVTCIAMLTMFNHSGLLEEGQQFFETMSGGYGLIPTVEHEICMVDLFGRAGLLEIAVTMMQKMQSFPNLTAWHALFGACSKWEHMELGRWALEYT